MGNGIGGFSGDGSAAVGACLFKPFGVTVDAAGDLYIAAVLPGAKPLETRELMFLLETKPAGGNSSLAGFCFWLTPDSPSLPTRLSMPQRDLYCPKPAVL